MGAKGKRGRAPCRGGARRRRRRGRRGRPGARTALRRPPLARVRDAHVPLVPRGGGPGSGDVRPLVRVGGVDRRPWARGVQAVGRDGGRRVPGDPVAVDSARPPMAPRT